jgi:SAM-dependent methyltransferase
VGTVALSVDDAGSLGLAFQDSVDEWWANRSGLSRSPRSIKTGWFHRYPARFGGTATARLFQGAQDRIGRAPRLILDPYAGSGTSLAAARYLGIPSVGLDLSPLAVLIMRVRLFPPSNLAAAVDLAENWHQAAWEQEPVASELAGWLGASNTEFLGRYLTMLGSLNDARTADFLRLTLSQALRSSSSWLAGSIKPQRDPSRTPTPLPSSVRRSARAIAKDCRLELGFQPSPGRALLGDAGHLPIGNGAIEAVLTSPPYFVSYDYFDVHRLTFLAFGWDRTGARQLGRRVNIETDGLSFEPPRSLRRAYEETFEGESTYLGRALRLYVQTSRRHLAEIFRVTSPGGVVAYAVADSIRGGRRFHLANAVAELLEEAGFLGIDSGHRSGTHRRILPAGRDRSTGRFSTDVTRQVNERVVFATKPI